MINERRDKINELKANIKGTNDSIVELVKELISTEDEEKKKELRQTISERKVIVSELKEKLTLIKMNKNDSSFFRWTPHKGMNRTQARRLRRLRRI